MTTTPTPQPATHTFELDGVPMRYHVVGSGPVCVIHPGGPGIAWEYLRIPLLEAEMTCVYVEPVGTGGSGRLPEHPDGYSVDRYTDFLEALLEHLDAPEVYLLGHSHGGFVAQRYAIRHPERLAGMILYATAPLAGPEIIMDAAANMEEFAARHTEPDAQEAFATWKSLATGTDEEYTRSMRALLPAYFADFTTVAEYPVMRETLQAWAVTSQEGPWRHHDELAKLDLPTLVLNGRWNFICGARFASELHEAIRGSELVTFDDSGHMVHLEEPEGFVRAVVDFVQRHHRTR